MESHEHVVKKECQPDAFAFAILAHEIHSVIPVSGTHEWKTVLTESKSPQNGAHAMVV